MKKIFILTALSICSISIANANTNNGLYTSLKAGISDTKYKNSSDLFVDDDLLFNNTSENKSVYPTISAAIGYDFSSVNARAELEYNYKNSTTFTPNVSSQVDTVLGGVALNPFYKNVFNNELTSQSLMLNGYYDFKNTSKLTPYLSAGIGFTHIKNKQSFAESESASNSDSDNHFTWSAGLGVAYAVSTNVDLDLSYRYSDAGKFKFQNVINNNPVKTNVELVSNEYLLGIRYKF